MTAIKPEINVYKRKSAPKKIKPGEASRIALIGAFDSTETNPLLFPDLSSARTELGTDTTNYKGCSVLEPLFYGASSILAVNITTKTGTGNDVTVNKDLTTSNLTSALAKIKNEEFDMLFVAEQLTDEALEIIENFCDERFKMKLPIGYTAAINRATATLFNNTVGLVGDHVYGLVTQPYSTTYNVYDLLNATAHYTGVLAALNVGLSMTQKQVPDIISLGAEYTFEDGDLGLILMQKGYTVFECIDRRNDVYVVKNSEQPNGLDLYINRVRDYVIRQFKLREFLGDRNRNASLNSIRDELKRVRDECVDNLDLLKDIDYEIIRKNSKCVDVYINKLLFDDIITTMNVYVTLEVEQ